ncbi:prolyl-tRNA synthetase associated domain-containing protein 1 isoform X1 [Manihot esculenta]|uniref:prolyl-tRNA synthetase associated domain-containing protein 1 isoform X1 n=1 Tax=Manihot esculenta TaxID=3983 RepID=UPI000B5D7D97|nr:prolyl-tRNA synthetase associated domain-containing protein 1 isoform X1 [Manihot esculenta]
MGYTKDQLLARLKELQIDFAQYEHPIVLTVEAQAKYVGDKGGGLSKNLFLKDKKSRFYIVSALADTKVDMKVLSQRLGLGKGGIRMAPEESLGEILQVPLGCVTPFAVVNESARHVSLLLDKGFKTQEHCFFHPLSNDTSISLHANDLDKFLKSIGREAAYVDLEANPPVGKDQPPDLAAFVPSGSTILSDPAEKAIPLQGHAETSVSADKKSTATADAVKTAKVPVAVKNVKEKSVVSPHRPSVFSDAELLVEEILNKTSSLVLSEIKEDFIRQHGEHLGTVVADNIRKRLSSDFKSLAVMFKNTAYAQGFYAGTHHHRKPL